MRHIITGTLVLASVMTGEAMARCNNGQGWSRVTALLSTLTNNNATLGMTACSLAGQGTQEEHHANFDLFDYKCGTTEGSTLPGTACEKPDTDRRKKLGTWSVVNDNSNSATVSYSYTAFGSDTSGPFRVFVNGSTYDFCNGNTSVGTFTLVETTGTSRVCPP